MTGIDVLIDVQAVAKESAGVPNVARNLVCHLLRRKDGTAYYVAGREDTLAAVLSGERPAQAGVWLRRGASPVSRVLSQHFWDGFRVNSLRPRIYFGPATLIPYGISSRTAKVSLIHDLAPFRVENIYPPARQRYHRWLMKSVAARADHLVAISDSTKRDIVEFLKVPEDRISVIPNATDRPIFRGETSEIERHRRRLSLPDRYILFVGKVQPRKNIVRLIKAFGMLPRGGRCADVHLVIAGGKGWLDEEIRTAHDGSRVKERILFTGYVSEADISWHYRCAEVFCFPSLYEGFGLPILEAMASGIPVAASNIGAMAEVVGDAGRTFDPYSAEDMARVLAEMLEDGLGRAEYSERGYRRVVDFSWERSAAEYASLWRKLR